MRYEKKIFFMYFSIALYRSICIRQGAADDDAHRVGHIVRFQRAGVKRFMNEA